MKMIEVSHGDHGEESHADKPPVSLLRVFVVSYAKIHSCVFPLRALRLCASEISFLLETSCLV